MKHLLMKVKIIFILLYLVVSIVLYFILSSFAKSETVDMLEENLIMAKAINEYITEVQKPAVYDLIESGYLDKAYFNPELMSSTYIVSHIEDNYNRLKGVLHNNNLEYKFASNNPTNVMNKANAYEKTILKKFNDENLSKYSEIIGYKGKKTLVYALAVERNTAKCLKCHGNPSDAPRSLVKMYGDNGFHEKLGGLHAINFVYAPVSITKSIWYQYSILNLFALVVLLIVYFTLRYFFMQLNAKDTLLSKQSRFAALGEMISMIAHQWRQPLTGMSMSINNLLLDYELGDSDDKRSKETLELINTQITYLSSTIDDFKNFFRPDIKSDKVNLKELIKDSCMIIDSSLKSNGINVDIDIDENIELMTKKNDIKQIVLNLIKNSMDAYKEKNIEEKDIYISAIEKANIVSINVKDNAGGIPKDIVEKIFDPYFSTKDKKNGTGLGLYMSKMIIEDHLAGELNVVVQEQSTIFTIVLNKEDV